MNMPPDVLWHVIIEGGALVFAAGGAWYMLRDIRKQLRDQKHVLEKQWDRIDEIANSSEARFRKTLVVLTMLAMSDAGDRGKTLSAIQGMAETNGS